MSSKGFKRAGGLPQTGAARPGAEDGVNDQVPGAGGPRRNPAAALAAAAAVAPTLPPTRVEAPAPADTVAQLNLKVRTSLIDQLARAAGEEGTTQKVVVCRALGCVDTHLSHRTVAAMVTTAR